MQGTEGAQTDHKEEHFQGCFWFQVGSCAYGQAGDTETPDSQDEGFEEDPGRKETNVNETEAREESCQTSAECVRRINVPFIVYKLFVFFTLPLMS